MTKLNRDFAEIIAVILIIGLVLLAYYFGKKQGGLKLLPEPAAPAITETVSGKLQVPLSPDALKSLKSGKQITVIVEVYLSGDAKSFADMSIPEANNLLRSDPDRFYALRAKANAVTDSIKSRVLDGLTRNNYSGYQNYSSFALFTLSVNQQGLAELTDSPLVKWVWENKTFKAF